MRISYNKLWKFLNYKVWTKSRLCEEEKISSSMAKLTKGENVTTAVLLKICKTLDSDICDIMEIIKEEN